MRLDWQSPPVLTAYLLNLFIDAFHHLSGHTSQTEADTGLKH